MKLDQDFLARMREATQLLQTAGPTAATAAIQRALHGASMPDDLHTPHAAAPASARSGTLKDINSAPLDRSDDKPAPAAGILKRFGMPFKKNRLDAAARSPVETIDADIATEEKGRFLSASCSNQAGTRAFRLYVPGGYDGQPLPLIVMLHGCKQHPDDFAAGTGMNRVAEQNNCFVVYPAQAHAANGSNCWNWFKRQDQQRDRGEPSIIADITRQVMREYRVDPSRVYVAGLSAGGAMAAIMGATYPDLYAAVGIHSGLPYGAAHDVPSAFAAMKNGATNLTGKPTASQMEPMPLIVFHGDRDTTVHMRNGEQALAQSASDADRESDATVTVEKGQSPQGRAYTRTMRRNGSGKIMAEQWIVHGAGHAWSGGSRKGSYTDPTGPDASQEMLRFFQTHARPAR